MSSWEEYKKKKKQSGSNIISINDLEMSSWERYKQEKKNAVLNNSNKKTFSSKNEENSISKIFGNLGYGLSNGLISLQEQFNRVTSKSINDRLHIGDNIDSKLGLPSTEERLKNILGENSDKPITNISDKLEKQKQTNTENIQKNIDSSKNIVTKKLAEVAPSIGQMLPGMLPGMGSTYFAGSAAGNYYDEAKQRGMSEEEAEKYSAIMGLAEGATEVVGGKITKSIGKNLIKGNAKQALKMFGLDILENFAEEAIMEPLSETTATLTAGKDKSDWNNIGKRMMQSGIDGAIVATIMGGASAGIGSSINKVVNRKTNNEQKVYDNEVTTRTKEKVRKATIERAYNEQIKTQENLGINITDEVKSEIMKKVENSYDNGKLEDNKLSSKELSEIEEQVQKDMEDGNISFENIMNILGENQDISKDNLLMKSKYENEQRYNSYQVEQTDNEKVNVLMQSAADAGMNNTSKTRKRVELISKLIKDTDRQYKFVSQEQLKEMGYNENANGLIDKSTGEILINSHSDKGIQSIVGHETTHIFDSKNKNGEYSKEYQNLQDIAIEYAKTKGIYDSKIKSITEAYGDILLNESQIKEELTADLVGDFLFNDTKFIENLAVKDRNIFQKIYDYIKHVYKVVTAGTEEAKALENLKYQFEKVYKTISEETNNDTKYSIAGKKAIENIKGTKFYQEAEENLKLAKQLKKEGKNNLTLIKKTGWFQDQAGDWKFEFSDKNMELKKTNFSLNKEYNLLEVLEHDELFYFYPELANYTVIFKNKSNSSYSAKDKTISLAYEKISDSEKLKGTLIHEIQHAIQHIENHAHGTTAKLGLMRYYNTLGEIEAADTKERYLNTVEGKRNTILPETAKENPTHQKIKNGDILYKITNGVYNFFHGGEKNVYKNKNSLEQNFERNKTLVDERGRIKYSLKEPEKKSGSFNLPKVEEGYTRLYRGLENEYNPNYDRTLLDNNNGYESWTNDYDLAKAYGDNVYYIDVPITDITDSIIDEDVNSETYGDRNLIYRNNKPVGIKGKNGNEYMLYTDHENYSSIQYNKVDNSQSIKDNQGRTLTKEQQEYFKDSIVRDENGNLKTMYHGSNSEFTIFDTKKSGQASKESKVGFWFTETKDGAEKFANSLWYGDKNAKAYETYLNIKNPKVYDTIDNSAELKSIDSRIEKLKTIIQKLENKNIAIEINKADLRWANENELVDIAKHEGIDYDDAKQYHDALKEYKQLEKEYDNKKYNDSYEQFRSDIYSIAGKSASDANFRWYRYVVGKFR